MRGPFLRRLPEEKAASGKAERQDAEHTLSRLAQIPALPSQQRPKRQQQQHLSTAQQPTSSLTNSSSSRPLLPQGHLNKRLQHQQQCQRQQQHHSRHRHQHHL